MILQPCNVELTKVHYYDRNKRSQNMSVSTISREMYQNSFNKNMIIKKNIFGHRWVLKINEQIDPEPKKKNQFLFVYILVFISLILAVSFGIIFSLDYNTFRAENKTTLNRGKILEQNETNLENNTIYITDESNFAHQNLEIIRTLPKNDNNYNNGSRYKETDTSNPYCQNCTNNEVCMKTRETEKPRCILMTDKRDPTGCGGLCKINTEYCKNLDKLFQVYQCLKLKNLLKCPEKTFNCGNMCIPLEKRCNGQIDCINMMDEKECECNLTSHFHCGNQTSCLAKEKICNGKVDCWDKSDEIHCQKNIFCEENYIPCTNGQCIPKEKMCDNKPDCLDRTDEPFWCQQITKSKF
ncbi:unnamed protein product [Ceutorhynchus assimilis]|uniref:Uncharacterized protein n=1 Tax=Ceutorhynchus assimilis TaxID=467358 RepID=A0A9N9QSP9_9CUCU|nr:unnamed protein product [Ceutorhynchus assimilis]